MLVTIGGSNADKQRTAVIDAVSALAKPMDAKTFAAAREAFLYHIASETQLPIQQADNLGWYAAEGNPNYAPSLAKSTYWDAARALDPDFVASVVRKYLSKPVTVNLTSAAPKGTAS
jgi:predicted Zn-dependent peptidase